VATTKGAQTRSVWKQRMSTWQSGSLDGYQRGYWSEVVRATLAAYPERNAGLLRYANMVGRLPALTLSIRIHNNAVECVLLRKSRGGNAPSFPRMAICSNSGY